MDLVGILHGEVGAEEAVGVGDEGRSRVGVEPEAQVLLVGLHRRGRGIEAGGGGFGRARLGRVGEQPLEGGVDEGALDGVG